MQWYSVTSQKKWIVIVRIINKIQFLYFNTVQCTLILYKLQQLAVSKENCNRLKNRCSTPCRSRDFLFAYPPRPVEDIKRIRLIHGDPLQQCGRWVKLSTCLHLVPSKVCAQIYIDFPKRFTPKHLWREITLNIICKNNLTPWELNCRHADCRISTCTKRSRCFR